MLSTVIVARLQQILLLLLLLLLIVEVRVVRVTLLLRLVVSQLDVAAAGAATDIASADTTQISLRVEVCGAAAD